MKFIKLKLTGWKSEVYIRPEHIIRMTWDSANKETDIVTEESEFTVKEKPEEIIKMIEEAEKK